MNLIFPEFLRRNVYTCIYNPFSTVPKARQSIDCSRVLHQALKTSQKSTYTETFCCSFPRFFLAAKLTSLACYGRQLGSDYPRKAARQLSDCSVCLTQVAEPTTRWFLHATWSFNASTIHLVLGVFADTIVFAGISNEGSISLLVELTK